MAAPFTTFAASGCVPGWSGQAGQFVGRVDHSSSMTHSCPLTDGVAGTAEKLPGLNHDPVTAHCADKYGFTRLAVTVQIGSQAAATNNLRIHYTASDGSGSLVERFTITECTTPTCPRLAYNAPPGDS